MLLPLHPAALVPSPVRPDEDAIALLLVVKVLAFVDPAVGPGEHTSPVHFVVFPVSFELSEVGPLVDPFAFDVVVNELAVIGAAVCPVEDSPAMFLAKHVFAFVPSAVGPSFRALAVLSVVFPEAFVSRSV